MDEDDHVAVKYKFYTTDEEWKPTDSEPRIELFRLTKRVKQIIPRNLPGAVTPKYDDSNKQNYQEIKKSVR